MTTAIKQSKKAHYIVYTVSGDEVLWHYLGNDLFDASDAYDEEKRELISNYCEGDNITLVFKNNWTDRVEYSFNTLKDI